MDNAAANAISIWKKIRSKLPCDHIECPSGVFQFSRIEDSLYKSKKLVNVRTFIITAISFIFRTRWIQNYANQTAVFFHISPLCISSSSLLPLNSSYWMWLLPCWWNTSKVRRCDLKPHSAPRSLSRLHSHVTIYQWRQKITCPNPLKLHLFS